MSERRVRSEGRQVYGRATGLGRPAASRRWRLRGPSLLQRRLVWLAIALVAMGWWCAWAFAVRTVVVTAGTGDAAGIKATAESQLQSSGLTDNLLLLNTGALSAKLQQADPALESLSIGRRWPHTVVITAVLQEPSLGWSTDGNEYLLDRDGTVIGAFPAGAKLPVVMDNSNLPVAAGKQVVSAQFVGFVQALVPALAADGYSVSGMSIQDTTFDLTVATNKGYKLIFDTTRAVGREVADLKAVQKVLTTSKQTPASYIDLRIAGKAYYK